MRHQLYYLFLFLFTLLMSCQHDPLVPAEPEDNNFVNLPPVAFNTCHPDTVYFSKDVFPLIRNTCARSNCHGNGSAKDGVDLTTYSSIINTADVRAGNPEGSDLYEVLVETDPDKDIMPPPGEGNLSAAQIALIRKWIEQGARNNSCENCDTLNVTFSGTIFPLIQNNCAGCHSGANPQGNISLTNYTQINARVQSGQLFGAVNHEAGFTPMPFNQPKLPPCQLDQIRIWIEAGAPNN